MSTSTGEFLGLRALVTGGASGIGLATARLLADRGARVACLDRDLETSAGGGVAGDLRLAPVGCDVTDDDSVRRAVRHVAGGLGGVDILINNAGTGARGTVEDNDDEEWRDVFDANVFGVVRVTRAALPHLRHSAKAAIVNVGSIAATAGVPERALYSATKGAVQTLTLAMAADHLPEGIRVNCVNPGTVDTPWVERLLASAADPVAERARLEAGQPMGRLVSAEEVAGAIAYLASPSAGATTGAVLAVDGGTQGLRAR